MQIFGSCLLDIVEYRRSINYCVIVAFECPNTTGFRKYRDVICLQHVWVAYKILDIRF